MLNADVGRRIVRHLSRHDIQSPRLASSDHRWLTPPLRSSLSLSLSLSLFLSLYFSRYTLSLASIEISSRCAIVISKRPPWNSLWRIADSLGGTLAFTSAISEASQISSDINTFAEFHTGYTHVSNEMYAFFEEFGPVKQ